MPTTAKNAKQSLQGFFLDSVIQETFENQELLGEFLGNLIYFVHIGDTVETEADCLNLGRFWRNRDIKKTIELCRTHITRCQPCRKRLEHLRDKWLDVRPV